MKQKIVHVLISAVVTGVFLYYVFSNISFEEFIAKITGVSMVGLFAYLGLNLLGVLLRMLRYKVVLKATAVNHPVPGIGPLTIVTLARNALVDFLPARMGEAVFVYLLNRYRIPVSTGLSVFGICTAFDVQVLGLLFFTAALSSAGVIDVLSPEYGWGLAVGVLAASLMLLALIRVIDYPIMWVANLGLSFSAERSSLFWRVFTKIMEFAKKVGSDLRLMKGAGTYPIVLVLTIGLRFAKYGSLYILLLAIVQQFGIGPSDLPLIYCFVAFASAEASASLPISGLMGFGAYEGAWVGVLALLGVTLPKAESIILALHLITQIAGYTLGAIGLLCFFIGELRSGSSRAKAVR